jgi:hypothetical protein
MTEPLHTIERTPSITTQKELFNAAMSMTKVEFLQPR